MNNKKNTLCNVCALSTLSLVLISCTSNNYDSIYANDNSAYSYSGKLVIPTSTERVEIVLEHQGTKGEGADEHSAEFTSSYNGSEYTVTEVRPVITTQDNFAINATTLGAKWNLLDKRYLGMNIYFNVMHLNTTIDIDIPAYLSVASNSVQVSQSTIQFAPKFELYIPVSEHIQITGSILTMGIIEDTSLSISSISLDYLLNKNLTLGLGYKNWDYSFSESDDTILQKDRLNFSSKSNVSLSTSGISGELTYHF